MSSISLSDMSAQELELYLRELWQKQLKLDEVNLDDDFLKLGGQSVDMFRMLAKLEDDLAMEVDFDDFFDVPNISSLRDLLLKIKNT